MRPQRIDTPGESLDRGGSLGHLILQVPPSSSHHPSTPRDVESVASVVIRAVVR